MTPYSTLYAAVLESRNYIVGAANAPAGLHRFDGAAWTHHGWRNVRCFGFALAPSASTTYPPTIYLACGNGVLRSRDGGATWRVTTGWQVAEVLGVAIAPEDPSLLYAATAYGVWRSPDGGDTWTACNDGLSVPSTTFAQVIAADASQAGRWLIGTEDGLFASSEKGWMPIGPRVPVRALYQSKTAPEVWLAGTEDYGVMLSHDAGASWTVAPEPAAGATVYAVAVAPNDARCMAAAGFETGLLISTDGGTSWTQRSLGLPARAIHALAFDPTVPGRLWIGTVGDGVWVTDDQGATCRPAGLPDTTVYAFAFAPEGTS